MTSHQMIVSVVIMAIVSGAIRLAPFVLFSGDNTPKWVEKLGRTLPCAVMGMLVIYCLKDVNFQATINYLPAFIAVAVTAVSYYWKRNSLLSIFVGTILYMALVQYVF